MAGVEDEAAETGLVEFVHLADEFVVREAVVQEPEGGETELGGRVGK
jgi:hypothetical protein